MPIQKAEGESYIKEYLRLQEELLQLQDLMQSSSENLKNYHQSGLISFIFTKERIDTLFQNSNDSNALRIYYGAHTDGEPTLVLVPCQVSSVGPSAFNKIMGIELSVDQHPEPQTGKGGRTSINFDLDNDPIS
jgi:hypothetical protein